MNSEATVSYINVGQGDSILIELPYRKGTYLIDTGGSIHFDQEDWEKPEEEFDVTKEIVLPFLKAKGISKLDVLLLSHGDMDHAGGALYLLDSLKVGNVFMANSLPNELEKDIQLKAKNMGSGVRILTNDVRWTDQNSKFMVLNPGIEEGQSSNNRSVVLWVKIYDTSLLFTGDIEKEAEHEIAGKFKSFKTDILKVPHHGSKTSTTDEFLEKASPAFAVISVGEKNIYGHPNEEVVERLKKRNITTFRTDLNGDIILTINSNKIKFMTVNTVQKTSSKRGN
jgi:competence protein ComEC